MKSLVAATNVQLIAGDALEHGLRNVLIGEPHQMLRGITIQGTAEYKASLTEGSEHKPFSRSGTESEFLLQCIIGMLDYYRRNDESVAFEGTECSPEWLHNLDAHSFEVKAAYVGYTDPSHINAILAHASNNKHDWINDWLQDDKGDQTNIRAWVQEQAAHCVNLKQEAESYGYPFFDTSNVAFEDYKASVLNYFLKTS